MQQRLLEAADELFSARGFDNVSVTDIAARAEVGRTTFFRYFGDKQEVVFAKQQQMLDAIARAGEDTSVGAATTATDALEQLRPIVLGLCEMATANLDSYSRHLLLLEEHVDLRGRDALKVQEIAAALCAVLIARGTAEGVAAFASQVALACYQTGKGRSAAPSSLRDETSAAFDEALALGQ
ncbi:TetR/AcrR family transcriptional regulator [Luteimicrobium sp. DT211]|uniref:TetR/AcrR family transcriptional regulator n=1 Tax=Luteimicrobium sp. DT211 TaxID=3393412 RepID=UPI003CF81094